MDLQTVNLESLSSLQSEILLSKHTPFATPEFKVTRYSGIYREGSLGSGDTQYIIATSKMAHAAWYTDMSILDFKQLDYR